MAKQNKGKKVKKEAEGFDDDFMNLMAVTHDTAKKTSRIPKAARKKTEDDAEPKVKPDVEQKPEKKPELVVEIKDTPKEEITEEVKAIVKETSSIHDEPVLTKEDEQNPETTLSDPKNEAGPKQEYKIDDFFKEYGADCYAHIYTQVSDRDFIRLIARFENVNINVLTDNIIQAWLNLYCGYFEQGGYAGFLEMREEFKPEKVLEKKPFTKKHIAKERNTTMRVSYDSSESIRNITTIEKIPTFKIIATSIIWWKNQYKQVLRKRNYYNFIKEFMKDVD